jgi:hypothetical protein
VARNNPIIGPWFEDYERVQGMMAVNAKEPKDSEADPDSFERSVFGSWLPSLDQLATGELTAPLVREKFERKQRLERQAEAQAARHQSSRQAFRQQFAGTDQPLQQLLFDEREAAVYMAEGGVLDRPTQLGRTGSGRAIIGGEAGREYVVPEGKTRDLGGGLKLFDTDELGKGFIGPGHRTDGPFPGTQPGCG